MRFFYFFSLCFGPEVFELRGSSIPWGGARVRQKNDNIKDIYNLHVGLQRTLLSTASYNKYLSQKKDKQRYISVCSNDIHRTECWAATIKTWVAAFRTEPNVYFSLAHQTLNTDNRTDVLSQTCDENFRIKKRKQSSGTYLDPEAGHLHPQAVCERLQTPLGDAVGSHVQAVEEGKDAGHEDHPAYSKRRDNMKGVHIRCCNWSDCLLIERSLFQMTLELGVNDYLSND